MLKRIVVKVSDQKSCANIAVLEKTLISAKSSVAKIVDRIGQQKWDRISGWFEFSKHLLKDLKHLNVSNAWCKCLELLSLVKFNKEIHHFDNASLPGDFIRATELFAKEHKLEYNWMANSLVGGLDDRYKLLEEHPKKWCMSKEMDGDVTSLDNIVKIAAMVKRCNLYTSDLGFKMNPFTEESEHLHGNIGQIVLGLTILEPLGTMITKQFTIFSSVNQFIIGRLLDVFDEVQLVKPETSKRDNSEIYLVCTGYHPDKSVLSSIASLLTNDTATPATTNLPDIITVLVDSQVQKIMQNVQWFKQHHKAQFSTKNWIKQYAASQTMPHTEKECKAGNLLAPL